MPNTFIRTGITAATAALFTLSSAVAAQGSTSIIKPVSFGISGGVAVPSGYLANGTSNGFTGVNSGYNVTGSLAIAIPVIPISLRGDASFNGFGSKNFTFTQTTSNTSYNADVHISSATANLVYPISLPVPILSPYVIGGVGYYNVRTSPTSGLTTSSNNTGFNIGGGVTLPLILANTFVEARYHRVNQTGGTISYVPITVGIMF